MDGRIFQLRNRILNDLKHQWTIEEMADYVELSAPHLQKLFKIQIGIPPISYVRELRLEKARELLETTFRRVKQIGFEVGMPNDTHFTRDFKERYGITPTEYRRLYWDKMQVEKSDNRKGCNSPENDIFRQEKIVDSAELEA